jgi:hypothetical protein
MCCGFEIIPCDQKLLLRYKAQFHEESMCKVLLPLTMSWWVWYISLSLPSHAVHLNWVLILKSSSKARDSMSEICTHFAEDDSFSCSKVNHFAYPCKRMELVDCFLLWVECNPPKIKLVICTCPQSASPLMKQPASLVVDETCRKRCFSVFCKLVFPVLILPPSMGVLLPKHCWTDNAVSH